MADITNVINKSLEMKDGKITERGWADISQILQTYSDKRYETARYLFVKDGKINRHIAITAQNPSATIARPDEHFLFKLKSYAEQTKSSLVFCHNHPSGYVEPSQADKETTKYIQNFFSDKFAGHIILDHGKFGIYEPKNEQWYAMIDEKFFSMEEGRKQFSIATSHLNIDQLQNKDDLIRLSNYAKDVDAYHVWNTEKWIPAFYATHNGFVQSFDFLSKNNFQEQSYETLKNEIKYNARNLGCNYIYLFPRTHEQKLLCEAFAQQTRMVQDIFFEKENGKYELSNYAGGDIFNTLTMEDIRMEDSINYEVDQEQINEDIQQQLDDFIEKMEVNHGMSEREMEQDFIESQRPDYYVDGQPHWYEEDDLTEQLGDTLEQDAPDIPQLDEESEQLLNDLEKHWNEDQNNDYTETIEQNDNLVNSLVEETELDLEQDIPIIPQDISDMPQWDGWDDEPNTFKEDLSKIIVFDTETTGLYPNKDELLQISIIDGNGKQLFNEYIKPKKNTSWEEAQKINGISPEMVQNCLSISDYKEQLENIFNNANMFMSYNGRFDVNFIEAAGIKIPEQTLHLDVIKPAASITQIPANPNNKRAINGFKYPHLEEAAKAIDFEYQAHNSLGDTLATLQVAKHIYGQNFEKLSKQDVEKYTIDPAKKTSSLSRDDIGILGYIIREYQPEIYNRVLEENENIRQMHQTLQNDPQVKGIKSKLNYAIGDKLKNDPQMVKELNNYKKNRKKYKEEHKLNFDVNPNIDLTSQKLEQETANIYQKKEKKNNEQEQDSLQMDDKDQKIQILENTVKQLMEKLENSEKRFQALYEQQQALIGQIKSGSMNKELLKEYENNTDISNEKKIYKEEGIDTGTSKSFNSQTAFTANCPIPKFGHTEEDGRIKIISNAHFKKKLLNEYDSSENKIILEYSDNDGRVHEVKMSEQEYRKMIKVNEDYEKNISTVVENSYDWVLYNERYQQAMKTDQNILRTNTASNFRHNYKILCKLYATNPKEAFDQARNLIDKMHPYEKKAFNKMRKDVGGKNFDKILLNDFKENAKGIEDENSLLINNNKLLYDLNKKKLELDKGAEIGNTGVHVGETVKMAFKFKTLGGRTIKTEKQDFKILKVSKDVKPEIVFIYNDETRSCFKLEQSQFKKYARKIGKKQVKQQEKKVRKDYDSYGFGGRVL